MFCRDAIDLEVILQPEAAVGGMHSDRDGLGTDGIVVAQGKVTLLCAEADHFGILGTAEAFTDCHQGDGFQEVGFSLGVIAEDEVDAVAEGDGSGFDISEIFKFDGMTDHRTPKENNFFGVCDNRVGYSIDRVYVHFFVKRQRNGDSLSLWERWLAERDGEGGLCE